MPLNNYNMKSGAASFGEGLLGGVMVGRKLNEDDIRNSRLNRAEARTKVIQGREDAAYTDANTVSPFKANPEHGPEVHSYLLNYGANLGLIDENGNIKNANKVKLREVLAKDENAQHDILQLQRRKLTGEISAIEQSLGGRPSDDLTGLAAETNKQLQEKKARLDNLNYTDKAWVAEQTAKRQKQKDTDEQTNKEKENVIRERTATATEKTADRATTLPTMRDKYARMPDGLEKVALGAQIKAEEKHELDKTRAGHENELEKARILAGGKTAAQEAKAKKDAVTQTTATVNKYYSDLSATVKEKLKDPELDPASKAEWQKIWQNISVYRNNDLKAVQNGADPPNIANLTGGTGQARTEQEKPAAQPAKAPQSKQPPPKEGDTFTGGKGSYIYKNGKWNLQTGAAVPEKSMVREANAATVPASQAGTTIQDDRPAGVSPRAWAAMTPLEKQSARDQFKALKKSAYMAQK